jgi:hypothetical protein
MKTTALLSSMIVALAFSAVACTGAQLATPAGFAKVEARDADYRATSPRGVVLSARTEKNLENANAQFWAEAIDVRLRRDGYAHEADSDVRSVEGLSGRQLRYTRQDSGRTYRYWVTVYATEKKVYVVEAGGDKEAFDPALPQIERAVLTVKD